MSKYLSAIIIILFLITTISYGKTYSKSRKDKEEAERIWELAIQAKGGRDNINKISNVLQASVLTVKDNYKKKIYRRAIELYVLPGKTWSYNDFGKSVFGTDLLMYNYEKLTYYFIDSSLSNIAATPLTKKEISKSYQNFVISLLLEPKGLKKAEVLSTRTERIKLLRSDKSKTAETDIVESIIDERRVDFAFDKQTHLLIQVSFYYEDNPARQMLRFQLFDYIESEGLKIPQALASDDGQEQTFSLEFNVEYNSEIFEKSPAKPAPDSWKKL